MILMDEEIHLALLFASFEELSLEITWLVIPIVELLVWFCIYINYFFQYRLCLKSLFVLIGTSLFICFTFPFTAVFDQFLIKRSLKYSFFNEIVVIAGSQCVYFQTSRLCISFWPKRNTRSKCIRSLFWRWY